MHLSELISTHFTSIVLHFAIVLSCGGATAMQLVGQS